MTKRAHNTISAGLLRRLHGLKGPAWLINVPASQVVWTNPAGRALLDPSQDDAMISISGGLIDPELQHGRLDRAMPAMEDLREILEKAGSAVQPGDQRSASQQPRDLVFWTPKGIVRLHVLVEVIDARTSPFVLVRTPAEKADRDPDHLAEAKPGSGISGRPPLYADLAQETNNSPGHAARAALAGQPLPTRTSDTSAVSSDAQTLQHIARRILEKPNGRNGSGFSLDELHAAAADDQEGTLPYGSRSGCHRHVNGTQPSVINFLQIARQVNPDAAGSPDSKTDMSTKDSTSRVFARLAHELRTPLSAIHTAAELLARERFGPIGVSRYRDYARDILGSAAHALEVINAMLDPHYLVQGVPPVEPAELNLSALIENTVSSVQPLAAHARVTLRNRLERDFPRVTTDARAIKQILLNLLTNAIKFTPAGGTITVATGFEIDGPAWVTVTDSGPGMSDQQISDIMNGRDIAPENDKTSAGLGYGLPLVLALAKAIEAEFELKRLRDRGLSARIVFPGKLVTPF